MTSQLDQVFGMKLNLSWGTSGATRICQGTGRINSMRGGLFMELSLQVAAWGIATVVFEVRSSWRPPLWLPNIPMICSNPNTSCHPNTSWGYVCYDGNHQCLYSGEDWHRTKFSCWHHLILRTHTFPLGGRCSVGVVVACLLPFFFPGHSPWMGKFSQQQSTSLPQEGRWLLER